MEFSPIGRAALRAREGERLTAYQDSVGVWTISVGVTSATGLITVVPGLKTTAAQSDALFAKAVESYVKTVQTSLKKAVPQEFFDACVSLCYNIGQPSFAKSTLVKRVNAGDVVGATEEFLKWKKPAVILDRRRGEYEQAKTPYTIRLPKARASDKAPVKVAASKAAPAPAPIPVVAAQAQIAPAAPSESVWSRLGTKLSGLFVKKS